METKTKIKLKKVMSHDCRVNDWWLSRHCASISWQKQLAKGHNERLKMQKHAKGICCEYFLLLYCSSVSIGLVKLIGYNTFPAADLKTLKEKSIKTKVQLLLFAWLISFETHLLLILEQWCDKQMCLVLR